MKKYRPANGWEGMDFMEVWCCRCIKYDDCQILTDTFVYDVKDEKYPKEWTFNDRKVPICTAFELEAE